MQCNEKRQFILPHSSVQLSASAESRVYVCAEELSSSSTLELRRGGGRCAGCLPGPWVAGANTLN